MNIQLLRADVASLKVDAMVTSSQPSDSGGANLLCKFVIKTEVPDAAGSDGDAELRRVTTRALERAEELAIASVALSPLWTKPPGIQERCARNMLQATLGFRVRAKSLQRVVFCLFGNATHATWDRVLQELDQ